MQETYTIHTDGSCLGNPGPGGWAVHVRGPMGETEDCGSDGSTTNNIMELTAFCKALGWLASNAAAGQGALIRSDSRYVIDGITSWIQGWKKRNWRKADGKPVLNKELWQDADLLYEAVRSAGIRVRIEWVKGHAGDPGNERVDLLARDAASTVEKALQV